MTVDIQHELSPSTFEEPSAAEHALRFGPKSGWEEVAPAPIEEIDRELIEKIRRTMQHIWAVGGEEIPRNLEDLSCIDRRSNRLVMPPLETDVNDGEDTPVDSITISYEDASGLYRAIFSSGPSKVINEVSVPERDNIISLQDTAGVGYLTNIGAKALHGDLTEILEEALPAWQQVNRNLLSDEELDNRKRFVEPFLELVEEEHGNGHYHWETLNNSEKIAIITRSLFYLNSGGCLDEARKSSLARLVYITLSSSPVSHRGPDIPMNGPAYDRLIGLYPTAYSD